MDIETILSDSAAQIDRAMPADERAKDWCSPSAFWFEAFTETVKKQIEDALEQEGAKCPDIQRVAWESRIRCRAVHARGCRGGCVCGE